MLRELTKDEVEFDLDIEEMDELKSLEVLRVQDP